MRILRNILLIFLSVCFFAVNESYAQKGKKSKRKARVAARKSKLATEAAKKHFANADYYLSAREFKKAYEFNSDNSFALKKAAESYMLHFDYVNAEKYYKIATKTILKEYPLARYYYALMLKGNGKYEEAQTQFEQFRSEYKDYSLEAEVYKEKAKQEALGCEVALHEMSKPQRDYEFEPIPPPVNTPYSEYAPVININDTIIVITSSRIEEGGKEFGMLGGGFSNIYRFEKTEDGWVKKGNEDNFDIVNSKFNESAGSFNGDFTKFYFTRCDERIVVDGNEEFNCAIYVTKLANGKWGKPEKLNENINMKGEWNAQPSVSPEGDAMFFVSKRPGGLGMHDIWYSTSSGKDDWGPAVNMGEGINTMFIDMCPRYYPDEKVMFFSSNGHQGFGGLDIFMVSEDVFFEDDSVKVKNVGLPFNSNRDDFYYVMGEKKGYIASNREGGAGGDDIYTFNLFSNETLVAYVDQDSVGTAKSISILGTVLQAEDKSPAADVEVALTNERSERIKSTSTDDDGKFRFENLPSDQNYKVLLDEEEEEEGKSVKNAVKVTTEVEYVVKDVHVKKSDQEATKTLFENIYFDFDSYALRPEAKRTLNELVEYYKQYPEIQIEMNANTDAIGSGDYNKILSKKRGTAAREYLISKGVEKSAIVVNAMGLNNPIAPNNSPVGRQLNRRVEFSIIGGPGFEASTMAYVIEPRSTIEKVAEKFNMTVDEIKELNDLKGSDIKAFRPLRVKRSEDSDIIAPVTMHAISPSTRARMNINSDDLMHAPAENVYIVLPSNTLFSIARLYGLSVEELKKMNNLASDNLVIGQRLKVKTGEVDQKDVDSGRLYIVQKGDKIETIAQRFGLSATDLIKMNQMDLYRLRPNMVLQVKK
ncbi:LysM peptidoglycan-binding domain-containing protein [Cytophagaceae bacterium ABcell3]|nr:LysM peptidoglycan-binding domain-containing protein [Cytophagaceae bacterium ABcell3]